MKWYQRWLPSQGPRQRGEVEEEEVLLMYLADEGSVLFETSRSHLHP